MKIYIERTSEYKEIEAKTVKELLEKLKINSSTVLISKNNELVTEKDEINEKDEIKIISVISGG